MSVVDAVREKVGFPITRMTFTSKGAEVIANTKDGWNPYRDILNETEIVKEGPLIDIKKSINCSLSQVYLIGELKYNLSGRNVVNKCLTLYHTVPTFKTMKKRPFENIVGKGENAGNQHFLLFP